MEACQEALRINSKDDYVLNTLGTVHFQNKQWEKALDAYLKAADKDTQNPQYLGNIGAALNNLGRFEEAIPYCEKAIAVDTEYADPYRVLAYSLNALRRYSEALEAASTVLRLRPTDAFALRELVEALTELGKFDEALKAAEEFTKRGGPPKYETLVKVGFCQYLLKQIEQAIETYKNAVQLKPDGAVAHNNLGYLFLFKGDTDYAQSHFRRCIELDPTDATAHYNLGACYLARGEIEQGIKEYKQAMEVGTHEELKEHIVDLEAIEKEHPEWTWPKQAKDIVMKTDVDKI